MPSIKNEEYTKKKVLDAIRKASPKDVSIHEIAGMTKLSRETVSKYVGILKAEGKIKLTRKIGKAKLFTSLK